MSSFIGSQDNGFEHDSEEAARDPSIAGTGGDGGPPVAAQLSFRFGRVAVADDVFR